MIKFTFNIHAQAITTVEESHHIYLSYKQSFLLFHQGWFFVLRLNERTWRGIINEIFKFPTSNQMKIAPNFLASKVFHRGEMLKTVDQNSPIHTNNIFERLKSDNLLFLKENLLGPFDQSDSFFRQSSRIPPHALLLKRNRRLENKS